MVDSGDPQDTVDAGESELTGTAGAARRSGAAGTVDAAGAAIVVGSGPNGLAAALTLARAGRTVTVVEASDELGGGILSGELTVPGLIHDHCSSVHPLAAVSEFMIGAGLAPQLSSDGSSLVRWAYPEVSFAHPLDPPAGYGAGGDGHGVACWPDMERTSRQFGERRERRECREIRDRRDLRSNSCDATSHDMRMWRRIFGPTTQSFEAIATEALQPMLHLPGAPIALARFGMRAMLPTAVLARTLQTPEAKALLAGVAGHAIRPFHAPASSAVAMMLGSAAHARGWPVAVGGSGAIRDAMIAQLRQLGGDVVTGTPVTSWAQLSELVDTSTMVGGAQHPASFRRPLVMLDTSPRMAAQILQGRLPSGVRRGLLRYRHGPGVYVLHAAIEGPIPWAYASAQRSATVHVGGSYEEIAQAEADVNRGRVPTTPFVMLTQPAVADPSRVMSSSHGRLQPIQAYAHVPSGFTGDATEMILSQIERFAPGFRDQIVEHTTWGATELAAQNTNFVGGDIATGENSLAQLIFRPRCSPAPYRTGVPGVYMCSAATAPGGGAHGMCGYNAAKLALLDADQS